MFSSMVLLFPALLGLHLASATPLSGRASNTTCSPPASSNISLLANFTITNKELGVPQLNGPFWSVFWVDPTSIGRWNLVKTGESQFIVEHTQVPGKPLTAIQSAGDVELAVGPSESQRWNITCTTCPSNGLATDCTFENFPSKNVPLSDLCILTEGIPELGNDALIGDCETGFQGAVGTSIQIDYHL